jgi:hypothetical protein
MGGKDILETITLFQEHGSPKKNKQPRPEDVVLI